MPAHHQIDVLARNGEDDEIPTGQQCIVDKLGQDGVDTVERERGAPTVAPGITLVDGRSDPSLVLVRAHLTTVAQLGFGNLGIDRTRHFFALPRKRKNGLSPRRA